MKNVLSKASVAVLASGAVAFALLYHGHTYDRAWEHDETHHWQISTCDCEAISGYEEHSPGNDGFCWICERALAPTAGVEYAVAENGEAARVVRFFGGVDQNRVNIASEYDGLPVTEISEGAFEALDTLNRVILPDTIKSIGERAFMGCSALTRLEIKSGLTSIGENALDGCELLKELELPSTVTEIGEFAFANCGLIEVKIPDGVRVLNRGTFTGCGSLAEITMGSGITEIGESAFAHCSKLSSVKIPDGVETIGYGAFNSCIKLKTVVLPKSVTSIGDLAFASTSELRLYYEGTAEAWAKIDKPNALMPEAYYYSETEPASNEVGTAYDGNYWRYVDGVPKIWE